MTYFPDKKTFLKLARKGNAIPVYREILADLETPVSCFMKLQDAPYSFLLESVEGGEKIARYSIIGGRPWLVFKSKEKEISLAYSGKPVHRYQTKKDPLFELEKILHKIRQVTVPGLPRFTGGAVGYLGYDTVRFIEKIPDKNKDRMQLPDSLFIFTDTLFLFDHVDRKIKVICNVLTDRFASLEEAYQHATQKIDQEISRLAQAAVAPPIKRLAKPVKPVMESNFTKRAFEAAVRKAKRYIKMGDIIQVVLSQSFKAKIQSDAFEIYRALRSINPSPYMFYLNCEDFRLVGSSPEVHVRCESGKATLRPIAGTRKRGQNASQDLRLEKELLADPKERAEHLMLVDLGRNDLGRVCEFKSVTVPEFMVIERYSHVMHIVSHVEGKLKKGKNIYDLLRATFPAGTISGAPKVRAMEIIDELENQKRSFYSGVVGYISYSGNLDTCIAIRSIVVKDGSAFVQAGAGIVADSDPAKEYQETVNKARALVKAIEFAETGVSL